MALHLCVNSTWIRLAADMLKGCRMMAICVVGFPLGAMATRSKALETCEAIADVLRKSIWSSSSEHSRAATTTSCSKTSRLWFAHHRVVQSR